MKKRVIVLLMSVLLCISLLAGCGESTPKRELSVENAEYYQKYKDKGLSINVYNWGEYIPTGEDGSIDLNEEFTKLTGIEVNYTTFATNEEMYAKLKGGAADYDVIIPSDYMISRMISEGMLEKINFENVPNFANIMDKFKYCGYDPSNEYSVPYTWGTVGIVYNKSKTTLREDEVDWDVLWNDKYKDNILMFDNPRDAFAIAEIMCDFSLNTEDPDELKAAAEKLKAQKPVVQAYVMDEIFDKMGGGEAIFAPYYAGDAVTMMADNKDLGFSLPKSGTNMFIDAMCIPKGAKNKELAEMYINFMCEAGVAFEVVDFIGYSTPNEKAFDLLDDETKKNKIIYPDEEYLLSNTEIYRNISPEANKLMQDLWTEIKSAK